ADYFGIASGRNVDKFAATGLTPVKSELVDAPYVEEFPMVMECKVVNVVEVGLHTQFIGEIMDVKADEDVLDANGLPDLQKVGPVLYTPEVGCYYGAGGPIGKAFSIGKEV
ncbi:MAG: flavin reductase family protein, partial [Planctomycetes bacterium]|nr:flavin reductase family protein [Planctomycetota bacterium]